MPSTKPSVAVVGCGRWGMHHVRTWRELGCLAVACDLDAARLAVVRERHPGVEVCNRAEDVLARNDIDAVVIATPAVTHGDLTGAALAAGKDVLVEKPMATDLAEAETLVKAAERASRVLMVGHVLEYHPAVARLRELVDEGVLGRLLYAYSNRLNFGQLRHEESALWSFAPHDVAVLLRLLGPPGEVWCRGGSYLGQDLADLTLLSLAFAGGVDAHVFVSWLHPFKEQRFVVVGDRQMAVFDDTAPWAEKLVLYPHAVKWVGGRVPVADKAAAVPVAVDECEPLRAECEHFVDCVASRRAPLTDGASGVQVLRVLAAAEGSLHRDGAPVAVGEPVPTARGSAFVHPTATVDGGAHLGADTRVWHYAHVMADATIGAGTSLGQNAFVGRGVRVGSRVKVQNNVSVYEGVELEDDVFCGPSAVFTNVRRPRAHVERKEEFEPTLVRRGATLGANCTVVCGVTIGRHALVAAGAVVTRDVPDHGLVAGMPARLEGWVCECGERLPDFDAGRAACGRCGRRYRGDGERVEAVAAAQEPGPGG